MVTLYEGGQTQELVEYPFVNLQNEVNINVMIKDKPVGQVRAQVREKREEGARKNAKSESRVSRPPYVRLTLAFARLRNALKLIVSFSFDVLACKTQLA